MENRQGPSLLGEMIKQALASMDLKAPLLSARLAQKSSPASTAQYQFKVQEQNGIYVKHKNGKTETISDFKLKMLSYVRSAEGARKSQIVLEIVPETGPAFQHCFSASAFSSAPKFRQALQEAKLGLVFTGSIADLQEIQKLIGMDGYEEKTQVDYIGMHKTPQGIAFVSQNRAVEIDLNRNTIQANNTHVMNPEKISVTTALLDGECITRDELQAIISPLFNFNQLAITAVVMGYIGSCFLKEPLKQCGVKHGFLFMAGEGGSGKSTTLEKIIIPIFACENATSATKITAAALGRNAASSNTIPLILEEYKRSRMDRETVDFISNMLRSAYDGHMMQCADGKATQSVQIRAPLILSGEDLPQESSIDERIMKVVFSKELRLQTAAFGDNMERLEMHQALLSKFGLSLLMMAMAVDVQSLQEKYKKLYQKLPEKTQAWPERNRKNLLNTLLGIALIGSVCKRHELSLEEEIGHSIQEVLDALVESITINLIDSDQKWTDVDKALSIILQNSNFKEGRDYTYINDCTEVAINMQQAHSRYAKAAKTKSRDMDVLDMNGFNRYAREKSYFVNIRAVRIENQKKPVKLPVFNVEKLKAVIGDFGTEGQDK